MGNTSAKTGYGRSLATSSNSKRPRWDGPGLLAPPGKPILVPGSEESQPDVVGIQWERSPYNGGSAIIGYLVEHRRLGSPHWVRSSPTLCVFPELTLSGLEPGWRYQFRVRAQNAFGLSEPSELSDPLTVTLQRSAASVPHFDLELVDTTALENDQVEFVVRYSGMPAPKISWFKDGFEIFSSRRTKILTDNCKSSLLIHQTSFNDEGEIKCTATNRAGHVSTKARLILEAPPRIRLPRQYEDGLLFEQDETIRLKVSIAGRPVPTVEWYHDSKLVTKDDRHTFEVMDGESVLKIPDAKRNDRGEYTIKATNRLGDDITSFLVTVTDRPMPPGKATVTMTLGRSVSLSWKEPEDDGGCKIGTYVVEYYRIGWDVWLKATTSRTTSAALSELIEGSEYKFRVKAENPYGVSDPSEESDVVFIPDLKRGITSPLHGKSQSHREISRSRPERREVSFAEPSQRTRSLTREGKLKENEDADGPPERSSSVQRLIFPSRPSRADSRVTFAPEATVHEESSVPPKPPMRTRDQSAKQATQNLISDSKNKIVTTTIPTTERNSELQIPVRRSRSRSISKSRDKSPSPLVEPKIHNSENTSLVAENKSRPSTNLVLKKQTAVVDDSDMTTHKSFNENRSTKSPSVPRDNDESGLHDSSEFMLVLYPEDAEYPDQNQDENPGSEFKDRRGSNVDDIENEEDLVPPPLSMSLPELFSADHQIVEVMREAVSSTELLHERAMERFYRAVAAEEEASSKRKTELERKLGELATSKSTKETKDVEQTDDRNIVLRRRLSNTGDALWQMKKNYRRSSEGQTETTRKLSKNLLQTSLLPDVEARSDPNISGEAETSNAQSWDKGNDEEAVERLRRWHESNVPLIDEKTTNENEPEYEEEPTEVQQVVDEESKEGEYENEEESIETSIESSEDVSSNASEDLRLLKSRILAQQVIDEEDTYHPTGRPTLHIDVEPPEVPMHRIPFGGSAPVTPSRSPPPVSPTVVPKSILKKRTEDPIPVNSFNRPIPPEIPINPQPAIQQEPSIRRSSFSEIVQETLNPAVMSESDANSVLSAGEFAKNRRMQARARSASNEEEENEEDIAARMAMISHYTEIVREHSSHQHQGNQTTSPRRSSVSEDQAPKPQLFVHRISERDASPISYSPEPEEVDESRSKVKNETKRVEREGSQQRVSRRSTPSKSTRAETPRDRSTSRTKSPVSRRRDQSTDRSVPQSRSSSKTRARAPSQEKTSRMTRAGNDESRASRERSTEPTFRRSSKNLSRPTSRSNSSDRHRAATPTESKMRSLQKALESKTYRTQRRSSNYESVNGANDKQLIMEANRNVRSSVSYVTDLTLLLAAVYVYIFKKEIFAVPFIALLFYRRIQQEFCTRFSRGWWSRGKK